MDPTGRAHGAALGRDDDGKGRSMGHGVGITRVSTSGTGSHGESSEHSEQSVSGRGISYKRKNGDGTEGAAGETKITSRGAIRGNRAIVSVYRTKPEGSTKKGSTGLTLNLSANYFCLNKKPNFIMNQYRVDFAPDIESIVIRRRLLREHCHLFGGYVFDGTSLFVTKKLQEDLMELISKREDESLVKITIKHTRIITSADSQSLQILNLILRKAMQGLKLQLVNRDYYDAHSKIDLPEFKLQLWPGYITSIRQHEQDILLCAEISHKVMRMETVLNVLKGMVQHSSDYKSEFMKQVIGAVVLTEYNNKTYRISDVDWNSNPTKTFDTKTGPVSFIDYYKSRYNLEIRDHGQPLLVSKASARDIRGGQSDLICLVPELCRTTGFTDEMRNNYKLMSGVSEHTRLNPRSRIERLLIFNRRLQTSQESSKALSEWNMALDSRLVQFNGRLLPQEVMKFGQNNTYGNKEDADWTRALRNCNMYTAVDLKRWCVIHPLRNSKETENFLQSLKRVCQGMKYVCGEPKVKVIPDDRTETYLRALDEFINMDPKLILMVFPNNRAERYAAVKKRTCTDRGVPTQVILSKTLMPKKGDVMSVATKVAIQLNCKLGGAPWMVNLPLSGLMTIGFDVCHDTRDKSKSYGALVASMDLKNNIQFFSTVSAHTNGEELSNHLIMNVNKALRCYREVHGTFPSRILFYRDGVGDGQVEYVHSHEVSLLKKQLKEIYEAANINAGVPKLCYIIVKKKLNTRIFNGGNNPVSGTVVDDVITVPEAYDFYLVSQTVRQGTVSPTSYNIIDDNMGLPADKLQILTYKMCHLYYNWSGTTRVPAMCQYAHKLAFLVGNFLHQSTSPNMERQLYFL